jgi:hypothetical protein
MAKNMAKLVLQKCNTFKDYCIINKNLKVNCLKNASLLVFININNITIKEL